MQSCLEKRSMAERHTEISKSDYQQDNQYSEKHKDALADGDSMGRGTKPEGHGDWKPDLRGKTDFSPDTVNKINYSNFDSDPNAEKAPGTSEDQAKRKENTVKSLYSWTDPYSAEHRDAKADGDMIGRGTDYPGHISWKPNVHQTSVPSDPSSIGALGEGRNFDTSPDVSSGPGTVADRYMRQQDLSNSLYSWDNMYDANNEDAKATGDLIGRGTNPAGHGDWKPKLRGESSTRAGKSESSSFDYSNFDTNPDTNNGPGTLVDRDMRTKVTSKSLYSWNSQYDDRNNDALATGDAIGRGTGSKGHGDWKPNCGERNKFNYSNFDTSDNAGTIDDQSMRKILRNKSIYSASNPYKKRDENGFLKTLLGDTFSGRYSVP